ncbi:MAG: hypothetical protein IJZ98_00595 [Bacteroidales bacterium]|nr:hypothetical protein [Bacteroidales bacterium]
MKNLVKYLLVFIIVAFFHAAGRIATISVDDSSGIDIEDVVSDDSFSSPDAEFSVPRQIQFTGSFRVQYSSRRTTSIQRTVSEFLKSGKSFNISSINSVGKNNIVINISVIEHAHKLVYLGKLII